MLTWGNHGGHIGKFPRLFVLLKTRFRMPTSTRWSTRMITWRTYYGCRGTTTCCNFIKVFLSPYSDTLEHGVVVGHASTFTMFDGSLFNLRRESVWRARTSLWKTSISWTRTPQSTTHERSALPTWHLWSTRTLRVVQQRLKRYSNSSREMHCLPTFQILMLRKQLSMRLTPQNTDIIVDMRKLNAHPKSDTFDKLWVKMAEFVEGRVCDRRHGALTGARFVVCCRCCCCLWCCYCLCWCCFCFCCCWSYWCYYCLYCWFCWCYWCC